MSTKRGATYIATRLVAAKPAARELGLPYTTLRDAVKRGELPVLRIGKKAKNSAWYFDRGDLDNWIEKLKTDVA